MCNCCFQQVLSLVLGGASEKQHKLIQSQEDLCNRYPVYHIEKVLDVAPPCENKELAKHAGFSVTPRPETNTAKLVYEGRNAQF